MKYHRNIKYKRNLIFLSLFSLIVTHLLLLLTDISLQDKIVIYDNEKQQIGWASAKCDGPSKS